MERKIDIIEIMLMLLPEESDIHRRIKLYLQTHKSKCNDYIFTNSKYKERANLLADMYTIISSDLCKEIFDILAKQG